MDGLIGALSASGLWPDPRQGLLGRRSHLPGGRCPLDFPAPLKLLWGQLRMLHSTGSTSVSHSPAAPGFRSAFPCWGYRQHAYTN